MAAHAFHIKQHDLRPPLTRILRDEDGDPINLTGAEAVRFLMAASGSPQALIATTCSVLSATGGEVEYGWGQGQTATVGYYQGEFEIRWAASTPQTVPNVGFVDIVIGRGIA